MRTKNPEYFSLLEKFIDDYYEANGGSPTVREISEGTSLSIATISRYLNYMKENGMIKYEGHRNIITRQLAQSRTQSVKVPVLGAVSCGIPMFVEENIEEYVRLPVALFGKGDFFILRANGESMIEAGIDHGDLVLIRRQNYAQSGQIVVALMENEATLKRFFPEPQQQRFRLHPENSQMNDIYVDECIIQGIAVKVLKDLE
ncbi:transcriptional repressor LexA [Anaerotignum sp.]|uniref:transcriptional repressor LexA n=1 Tax=Anaerotignum sp. TaxID=2039241 RepID=UPI0033233219